MNGHEQCYEEIDVKTKEEKHKAFALFHKTGIKPLESHELLLQCFYDHTSMKVLVEWIFNGRTEIRVHFFLF